MFSTFNKAKVLKNIRSINPMKSSWCTGMPQPLCQLLCPWLVSVTSLSLSFHNQGYGQFWLFNTTKKKRALVTTK